MSVVMVLSFSFNAFASIIPISNTLDIIYEQKTDDGEVLEQLSSYDGSEFYFLKTDEYVFASEKTATGYVDFSVYYPEQNIAKTGEFQLDSGISLQNNQINSDILIDMSDELMDVSNYIMENLNILDIEVVVPDLEVYEEDEKIEIDVLNEGVMPLVAYSSLSSLVKAYFPDTYTNKLLSTTTKSGVTCRLTEAHSIYTSRRTTTSIAAGTALSLLVSIMSLPIDSIWDIVSWTITANGVRQTAKSFTAEMHLVEQNYTKIATIYNQTEYWAGHTKKYYASKGDLGWAIEPSPHYNVKHSDFDSNSGIVNKAFDNYFNYN